MNSKIDLRGKASSPTNTWGVGPRWSAPEIEVSSGRSRLCFCRASPKVEAARVPPLLFRPKVPASTTLNSYLASTTTRSTTEYRVCSLTIEIPGTWIWWCLDFHMFPIVGSHTVGEVPHLLEAQGDLLPISSLWYWQKCIHPAVPNGLGHIWHNVCHSGDANTVTGSNGGIEVSSCQVT